jgi:hypothetical protein
MYDLERLKFLLVTIDICAALSVGQNMASGKTRIVSAGYIRTCGPGLDMRRTFNQKALMGVGEVNDLQRSRDAAEGVRVVKGLILLISGRSGVGWEAARGVADAAPRQSAPGWDRRSRCRSQRPLSSRHRRPASEGR